MPSIANANEATKDEIRDLLDDMNSAAPPGEHTLKWAHQGGQGHGTQALIPHYASFAITGFTQTGNTTDTSTTIASLDDSMRPRPGMTVTGDGIPVSTTVVSVDRTANSMVISNAAEATATGVTLTFSGDAHDPVVTFGYNSTGAGEIIAGEGRAVLQVEGHYHRNTDDAAFMEIFFDFNIAGSSGGSRPVFALYDKILKKTTQTSLSVGQTNSITFTHENHGGAAGENSYTFAAGVLTMRPDPAGTVTDNCTITMQSKSGAGSRIAMQTDGKGGYTAASLQVTPSGNDNNLALVMSTNAATPVNVAGMSWHAPSWSTSVLMSIGQSAGNSHSMLFVTNTSGANNIKCLTLTCKASQTAPAFEIDGIADAGTAEGDKYQIHPKGYVMVKPSGGAVQSPTAGAGAVTPVFTDKPGTSAATAAVSWFPILNTSGALFWVPGFAN